MADVAITLPSGEAATVPVADLSQALAAGARPASQTAPKGEYEDELGGGLGRAASFAFGAGRTASFGTSDALLAEGANILGGSDARSDMLRGLNAAKDTNPYTNLGGEAAGLFVGAGAGVVRAGGAVEKVVSGGIGAGLLGKVGGMAARGAVEGGALGYQHQISEDALGDVDYNGEKTFATASKDGLLGAAGGAVLGGLGHYAGEAFSAIARSRGPRPGGLLDELAGVEGAGAGLREEARQAESLVGDFQKAGATSEQGAVLADEAASMARARAAGGGGPLSSIVDDRAAQVARVRAGGNADLEEVFMKGYADRASKLANQEGMLDATARKLADKGTAAMRNMEDVVNDAQFAQKGENMAKLVDPAKWETVRDTALKSLQDADSVLSKLEATASKGGQEGAVNSLRKQLTDFYAANEKIGTDLLRAGSDRGARDASRDFFMRMDSLKRSVDKFASHGTNALGRSEAAHEFRALADRLRVSLEDEATFGGAAAAQRETNSTFSLAKGRRDDFGRRFAVSVDQVSGVPVPELDAGKLKAALRSIDGAEGDQAVKTTEAFIDGLRARSDAVEKHFALDPAQASKLAEGRKALDEFADQFAASKKEATVLSRLRTQQLEEHGHGLGGVLGLASSIITKPLQTMERLGALKAMTEKFEKGIENGINRFFDGKGTALMQRFDKPAEAAVRGAARSKDVVASEIGELRELAANPSAMQSRVGTLLGGVTGFAPKIGGSASLVALRALTYLAGEAPTPRADVTMLGVRPKLRFSDQQLSVYENKRNAAFHPETVVAELNLGKLNRDGIRTVKAVYPQMFAMMQDTARTQLMAMETKGLLDSMPYQRKAAIASLLEVAPDGTWKPDFMALMQSTKLPSGPGAGAPPGRPAPGGGPHRPIKINTAILDTEAQQIEGRTT